MLGLGWTLALALQVAHTPLRHVRLVDDEAPTVAQSLHDEGFDVLPASTATVVELIVGPEEFDELVARGWTPRVLQTGTPLNAEGGGTPAGYPDLATVVATMQAAAAAHPAICSFVDLTATFGTSQTFEGRSLFAIKISDNVLQDEDEPNVLLVGGHHAREIVTPVIALDQIDRLTTGYGVDPTITQVVDDNEIWIAPVFNPDGYVTVFTTDNLWRKNRRVFPQGIGVDQNRNYPFGWDAACGGSTSVSSSTYKGPSAGSEAETQTMVALSAARRWAKVQDNHSSGQEVRYGFGCLSHPWFNFMQSEATSLSIASGYGGTILQSCCMGGEFGYQIATFGAYGFLWETATTFQPSFAAAQAEAALVWPGALQLLTRPTPISGHVTDACSGAPVEATITFLGVNFSNGEKHASGGPFGRFHAFPPPGSYTLRIGAPGYAPTSRDVTLPNAQSTVTLEVALIPSNAVTVYCTAKVNSQGCTPAVGFSGQPSLSDPNPFDVTAAMVLNQKNGLLFYGYGGTAVPFQGGTLCALPPLRRTGVQSSGGNPPPSDCSGAYAFDFNAWIQSGTDPLLVAGANVNVQFWSRDPAASSGAGLTDAATFGICP